MPATDTSFLGQSRSNPRVALIAVLMTAIIVGAFFYESHLGFGERPQTLIYVQSWPKSRTADDARREQAVGETARQAAIAEFEIERGQALASRAETPVARAAAAAHVAASRAALARWQAAHEAAQADLARNPPVPITKAKPVDHYLQVLEDRAGFTSDTDEEVAEPPVSGAPTIDRANPPATATAPAPTR